MNEQLPIYPTWIIHKGGQITLLSREGGAPTVRLLPGYAPLYNARLPRKDEVFAIWTLVRPDDELTPHVRDVLVRIGQSLGAYGGRCPANAVEFLDAFTLFERQNANAPWRPRRGGAGRVVVRRKKPPVVAHARAERPLAHA